MKARATWVRNKGPILAELSNYPWGPNHLALPQKQQTLITRRKLIRPRLLEQILVCAHSSTADSIFPCSRKTTRRGNEQRGGEGYSFMRLFPFALTQSEEQLLATSPVSLSQTHLPQNTFRRLSLPFRPLAARGHSSGTRPPPPQGLPSHALVSPPASPLPRFLATLHSIARTGSRPSVRPSFRSPSVSREASFSAPTKAQKGGRIEGKGG